MKRLLIGLLIIGGIAAAVAVILKRRSESDLDEWDSFADDTFSKASDAVSSATDSAKDTVSEASEAAKDAASKAADAAK